MNRLPLCACFILLIVQAARGAGFECSLEASDGKTTQSAKPGSKDNSPMGKRVVLEASAASAVTVKWKVVRAAKDQAKDVLVHFYVVKLTRAGQAPPPLDPKQVTVESALTMDFPAKETASGSQPFQVDGAGIYLIRIEAGADPDKPGMEDFAEIELVAK
ncbi:MAG TPA: hypothetical protein VLJ39_14395 [Tepidisphaeraceae bacterium]|jgi:hypothetical protein|nr:hypothetical protein [Tepidisphaeraceae bacterium]